MTDILLSQAEQVCMVGATDFLAVPYMQPVTQLLRRLLFSGMRPTGELQAFWGNLLPPSSALKMEAVDSSKMLTMYQCTWHHMPEDNDVHNQCWENCSLTSTVLSSPFVTLTNYHTGSFTQLKLLTSSLYYSACYLTE
jgi:hypothetical protein